MRQVGKSFVKIHKSAYGRKKLVFLALVVGVFYLAEFKSISLVFLFIFSLMSASFELAEHIAAMSPVAIQGTKVNLNYARDHSVQEGLDFVVSLYSAHIIMCCVTTTQQLKNGWTE